MFRRRKKKGYPLFFAKGARKTGKRPFLYPRGDYVATAEVGSGGGFYHVRRVERGE
jgi:hypothetical protein